jgi:hypothetical protein
VYCCKKIQQSNFLLTISNIHPEKAFVKQKHNYFGRFSKKYIFPGCFELKKIQAFLCKTRQAAMHEIAEKLKMDRSYGKTCNRLR